MKTDFFSQIPLVYLITNGEITDENYALKSPEILNQVKNAVEFEVSLIQIREKKLSAKLLFDLAAKSAEITKKSSTKILINDRADIALAANADGVQLTENSLSPETIRANFPKEFIIGVSAHTLEKAKTAKKQGANFVTFSPIFHSPNKGKPVGLKVLHKVCEKLKPFPIIALGGIDETNYREVLRIASGLAAIRFFERERNFKELKKVRIPCL